MNAFHDFPMHVREAEVTPRQRKSWKKSAELLLKELGMIQRSTATHCGITNALTKLDAKIPASNWRKLFGSRYTQAELQAV